MAPFRIKGDSANLATGYLVPLPTGQDVADNARRMRRRKRFVSADGLTRPPLRFDQHVDFIWSSIPEIQANAAVWQLCDLRRD